MKCMGGICKLLDTLWDLHSDIKGIVCWKCLVLRNFELQEDMAKSLWQVRYLYYILQSGGMFSKGVGTFWWHSYFKYSLISPLVTKNKSHVCHDICKNVTWSYAGQILVIPNFDLSYIKVSTSHVTCCPPPPQPPPLQLSINMALFGSLG